MNPVVDEPGFLFNSDKHIEQVLKNRALVLSATGLTNETAVHTMARYLKGIRSETTVVISFTGGAASGKSTFVQKMADALDGAVAISTDDFLLGSREYRHRYLEGKDPLRKYDFQLLRDKVESICRLEQDESVFVPVYDEKSGIAIQITDFDAQTGAIRSPGPFLRAREIKKPRYLIVHGDFQPLGKPDLKIFFHVPDAVRLVNRIHRDRRLRDTKDPQDTVESFVLRQRLQHAVYTLPCADEADVIIVVCAQAERDGFIYSYSFWTSSFMESSLGD